MNAYRSLSRRDMFKMGAVGLLGLASAELLTASPAFASEFNSEQAAAIRNYPVPMIRTTLVDSASNQPVRSFEAPLLHSANLRKINDDSHVSVNSASYCSKGSMLLYSVDLSLESADNYVEESKENEDQTAVQARVTIGANWGPNQSTVQIVKGQFEIIQKNPLVTYSNTWYALMQKSHHIQQNYNGSFTQLEPGWGAESVNPETDAWTCGGATGGLWTDLITGQVSYFTVELYLL